MVKATGLNRTHLIELMQHRPQRKSRQRQGGVVREFDWMRRCNSSRKPRNVLPANGCTRCSDTPPRTWCARANSPRSPKVVRDLSHISISTLRRHLRSPTGLAHPRRAAAARLVHPAPLPVTCMALGIPHIENEIGRQSLLGITVVPTQFPKPKPPNSGVIIDT